MKVLITGIAGFVGSRLAEALLGHGHEVSGIDNLTTGRRANVPGGARFTLGDIRYPDELVHATADEQIDLVYHCAASYKDRNAWEQDASTNVTGTINVVRLAKRSGARLVYFQTALCYGPSPVSPVTTDAPLAPVGSYAVSKTAGEAYIRDSGLDWVSLRLANIYGPRNLSGPLPTFHMRLSAGEPCTVMDARRDFVFIDDLVWVAVRAGSQGHGVYHVASGTDYAIADLYRGVTSAMHLAAREPVITPRGADDVATILLDPSGTLEEFGWTARTPLAEGIAQAVAWYRSHPVTETYTHLAAVR